MQMPFAITTVSFWRVCVVTPTIFVGAGSAKITLKMHRAAKAASSHSKNSLVTDHGCTHYSRPSTCATDGQTDRGARHFVCGYST